MTFDGATYLNCNMYEALQNAEAKLHVEQPDFPIDSERALYETNSDVFMEAAVAPYITTQNVISYPIISHSDMNVSLDNNVQHFLNNQAIGSSLMQIVDPPAGPSPFYIGYNPGEGTFLQGEIDYLIIDPVRLCAACG